MNPAECFEFEQIRDSQKRIHLLVDELDRRIDSLVEKMAPVRAIPSARKVLPPPLPTIALSTAPAPGQALAEAAAVSADLPKGAASATIQPEIELAPPVKIAPIPPPPISEPLELRVGTFWMARIGIVVLLTGLVFLGNYAYHRIVPLLGPWGKLSLLALAGGLLTGAGVWLEKAKEALRNYGRVLLAGGAAALYYTTYAAHFVAPLKVIENPLVGGALLLAVGGGIIGFAQRRRSETVALLAILLSYCTSAINPIGSFTLFSNLLLTSAAVFFLIRHRWTTTSFVSLVATYGSYAFWRFHQFAEAGITGSFGIGPTFLAGYWLLFTLGVLIAAPSVLSSAQRTAFLTANNGAFFGLTAHHFAVHRPEAFWMFSLGYGAALLALSVVVRKRHEDDSMFSGAYLAQGLIGITLGFVMKLTGPALALVLAVESAVLLAGIRLRHRALREIAASLCALGALGVALYEMRGDSRSSLALGLGVSVLLLFDAWLVKFLRGEWWDRLFSPRSFVFAVLGLTLIGVTVWHETPAPWQPGVLAAVAVAGLLATRIRLVEITLTAQAFAFVASMLLYVRCLEAAPSPWWSPLIVLLAPLILMHSWQRATVDAFKSVSTAVQLVFAGVAIGVAMCWIHAFCEGDPWLVAMSALALVSFAYGLITRSWSIALAGQFSLGLAVRAFANSLVTGHPHWAAALSPVLAFVAIALLVARIAPGRWPTPAAWLDYRVISQAYQILAAVLFAGWALEYVPANYQVAFFAGLGAGQILIGSLQHARNRTLTGVAYAAFGMAIFWSRIGAEVNVLDLVAILAVPASLRWGEHFAGKPPVANEVRHVVVSAALLSLWIWVTRWTQGHGGQVTAMWAFLALLVFAAGLSLRERVYRFGGFAILSVALLRLYLFDVWRLDTLYRIVSFLVLGVVLLILSFVYSRFAETFRRWL